MSESELFVVRVWCRPAGDFRATVRRVDGEQTHHFSRPDEVVRFLSTAAQPGTEPSDAVDSTAPPRAQPKEQP
jgi:hypothetical protein